MITDRSVKMVCYLVLILVIWGIFFYCLTSGQNEDITVGVGIGAGILNAFGMVAISEV